MAYLTEGDLTSHIYQEVIEEITRNDSNVATEAIEAAIDEAKSYLNRFDTTLLFAENPTPNDKNLKMKVKDMACWHLVKLANPNINFEVFKEAYDDAIKWFVLITKGQLDPEGWPEKADDEETEWPEGGTVYWTSNEQRDQHL